MRRHTLMLAAATALGATAPAALAEGAWSTAPLIGRAGASVQIPAQALIDKAPPEHTLLHFTLSHGAVDEDCALTIDDYGGAATREWLAHVVTTPALPGFCGATDPKVSQFQIERGDTLTSNGSPAAVCAGAYTRAGETKPGMIDASLILAAPDAAYFFECVLHAPDQAAAEADWRETSAAQFDHMQASLKLPPPAP